MQMLMHSPDSPLASLVSSNEVKPGLTLITGPRGSGKTRWCMSLSDHAAAAGIRVGGLVSPSVFENGRKVGIDLVDLKSGDRRHLAYSKGSGRGDLLTTDWQLDVETLTWGNSILERTENCDFFILDELGPLEFNHDVGLIAGLEIIETRRDLPIFATVRPSLISGARLRWYWAEVWEIPAEAKS